MRVGRHAVELPEPPLFIPRTQKCNPAFSGTLQGSRHEDALLRKPYEVGVYDVRCAVKILGRIHLLNFPPWNIVRPFPASASSALLNDRCGGKACTFRWRLYYRSLCCGKKHRSVVPIAPSRWPLGPMGHEKTKIRGELPGCRVLQHLAAARWRGPQS